MLSYTDTSSRLASQTASPHTMGKVQSKVTRATPPSNRHIWIITGPAGCGKSSVAKHLAKQLSLPYIEGDDVRTPCPTPTPTTPLYHPLSPLQQTPHVTRIHYTFCFQKLTSMSALVIVPSANQH